MDRSLFPTSLKLYHSAVAAVPQHFMALPTEMDSMRLAIMRQIKQKRDGDMAGRRNYEVDGLWRLLRWCELYLYYIRLVMEYSFYFSYQDKHQAIYLTSQSTKCSWEKY